MRSSCGSLSTDTPEAVSWWIATVWAAVLVALVVLAWWILKKWKAENAGITGSCRIFAEITAALTGFMMFALVFAYIFDYSTVLAVILGILAFAAMHLFWKKRHIRTYKGPHSADRRTDTAGSHGCDMHSVCDRIFRRHGTFSE